MSLSDLFRKQEKKPLGLYIHIPFCRSKCDYCDFCSFVPNNQAVIEHYTDALLLQMEDWRDKCRPYEIDTVYIGGGTPTFLDMPRLQRIIEGVYRNFKVAKDAEFSMESNPATVNFENLRRLRRLGVNRLSIGMQSAVPGELKALGRSHTVTESEAAFNDARRAGFDNISIDLMYGIPEQTVDSFMQSLSFAASRAPEHISLYALKIEDGTPFARRRESLPLPDEDAEYEMYMRAIDYLGTRGYKRYEISNFAKPGYESKHNLKYWHCDEYLGLGASAHSYFGRERFSATRVVRDYIDGIEIIGSDINIIASCDKIRSRESMDEYVMLGMRLDEGVNIRAFDERFGVSFKEKYGVLLDEYIKDGFVECDGENYRFTSNGMFVSNYILSSVLDLGVSDK